MSDRHYAGAGEALSTETTGRAGCGIFAPVIRFGMNSEVSSLPQMALREPRSEKDGVRELIDEPERVRRKVHHLARFLDARFQLPGTKLRFGWDSVIGLLPGADLVMVLPSIYIARQAGRLKLPLSIRCRMWANLGFDLLFGLIPVFGDVFDFFFKANARNARLFEKGLIRLRRRENGHLRSGLGNQFGRGKKRRRPLHQEAGS